MKKRGRPSVDNPRVIGYRLRLTKEEKERLDYISEKCGVPASKILRQIISDKFLEIINEIGGEQL